MKKDCNNIHIHVHVKNTTKTQLNNDIIISHPGEAGGSKTEGGFLFGSREGMSSVCEV